jgi:hypothetical protein
MERKEQTFVHFGEQIFIVSNEERERALSLSLSSFETIKGIWQRKKWRLL